jgi:DNA replication factor GINS
MLYEAWKKEKESRALQQLDKSFYIELNEHIRIHREELQMLDDKTLRARLTAEESDKIGMLFKDLLWTRYRKIFEATFGGKHLSTDLLTSEEEAICSDISSAIDKMKILEKDILKGRSPKFKAPTVAERSKRILVRFLQVMPAIVGPNAKVYGPFKVEDVASLPIENAESLIKRGVAVKVEIE